MPGDNDPPRNNRPTIRRRVRDPDTGLFHGPGHKRERQAKLAREQEQLRLKGEITSASPRTAEMSSLRARWELLTYAFSILPPRQLPVLAAYACIINWLAGHGWIPAGAVGKAGGSIVGVLSMVTGLLLSYRFSSAVNKWEEGKKVWVEVRTSIRDGVRMLSIVPPSNPIIASLPSSYELISPISASSSPSASETASPSKGAGLQFKTAESPVEPGKRPLPGRSDSGVDLQIRGRKGSTRDLVLERTDELSGLIVGFAFALQHFLHGTRPLPQTPLCDLLPSAYLTSLKRTEARVRFADLERENAAAACPSPGSEAGNPLSPTGSALELDEDSTDTSRPGLRRRWTGPPSDQERKTAAGQEEWELSALRDKAEEAVAKLAQAVAGAGVGVMDQELRQQLNQLNRGGSGETPVDVLGEKTSAWASGRAGEGSAASTTQPGPESLDRSESAPTPLTQKGISHTGNKPRSNLASPIPPNLPLTMLKLMEAYIVGLADIPADQGGWSEAKRERALGVVKSLAGSLGQAERLASNPPPLPLTLHLSHLLLIYLAALPCSLLCVVSGWALVLTSAIAGWCLLGLEALVGEVGGVFGGSENHQPLPQMTRRILSESLDISPSFLAYYRARVALRAGQEAVEVLQLEQRKGRAADEWLPTFS